MGQLTIPDVDEEIIEPIRAQARAQDRSLGVELRDILYLASRRVDGEAARRAAQEIRRFLAGKIHGDSADRIREDRDR